MTPLVIAHRACPLDAAENSLAGLAAAAASGADAVEVDVRLTRDRVPVLFHDRLGWRLARSSLPIALTGSARLATAVRRHPGGLVTLSEALAACPRALRPALDVKSPRAIPLVIEALRDADRLDALVWCRDPVVLRLVRQHLPEVETALLRNTRGERATLEYIQAAAAARAGAVSIHQRAVTPTAVRAAQRLGLRAYAWVVNESGHEAVLATGVDGVVTDWPRTARALVDAGE